MRVCLFCHSLVSDWNHGNAHFLRGVVRELIRLGHDVRVYEPADGWSRRHLAQEHGAAALQWYEQAYPELSSITYEMDELDLEQAIGAAHLVLVHEWTDPALVNRIATHHARHPRERRRILFHDTHHRSITRPEALAALELMRYDGVLAFGRIVAEHYRAQGWARRVWVWHEAADTSVFRPRPGIEPQADLVWIGNWGDEERTAELETFLLEPARKLGLSGTVYGVRYPRAARTALRRAGLRYGGYLPNHRVPAVMAQHRMTVHVPRRPYVATLPGIPTIRPFEALACGMPLVSAPWRDDEALFEVGRDFLMVHDGAAMTRALQQLRDAPAQRRRLAQHGRSCIMRHHTVAHRVCELLAICRELDLPTTPERAAHAPARAHRQDHHTIARPG
ncbi:MAG: CgeB family protein [Phycisphaeraceae bacterium]